MSLLLPALIAFFVAAASPGPATLAQAQVAMARGRAAGLRFGLGLSLGLSAWGLVAALGVGALLVRSAELLLVLKIAGGLYLLYLAFRSARSAAAPAEGSKVAAPPRGFFAAGLLFNLSNPKAVFAWLAVLAVGLPVEAGVSAVAGVVISCAGLGLAIYAAYAVMFSTAPARSAYAQARRWIDAVAAVIFAALGLRLILGRVAAS